MAMVLPRFGRVTPSLPYDVVEGALMVAATTAAVALMWTLVKPLGPLGNWRTASAQIVIADPTILTRFDPFFRNATTTTTAVTSLPLKLFGTRVDQAMGRGSAIIAGPDNVQSSFAIGDEIVPGARLKSVAFDSVTIERGGATEQLFLDQSVAAPVVAPAPALPGALTVPPPQAVLSASPMPARQAVQNDVAFAPRIQNGTVTGFTLTPKEGGAAFRAAGLQPGDVVTSVNGQPVVAAGDALQAFSGSSATLIVERGGKPVTLTFGAPR